MSCGNVPGDVGSVGAETNLMPHRPCFEANVQARFIRQLYPPLQGERGRLKPSQRSLARPPRQSGIALITLSGGAGSMALLDLLCRGGYIGKGDGAVADKTKGEKQTVWDKGVVIYVEFCGVVSGEDRMEMMRKVATDRGLDFVGLRAEDVYDPGLKRRLSGMGDVGEGMEGIYTDLRDAGWRPLVLLQSDTDPVPDLPILPVSSTNEATPLTSLRNLHASLPPASRPALLSSILSSLLNLTTQSLPKISHLLLGETSTRQAQRVISGTALGRGWTLPLELASSLAVPATSEGRTVTRLQPMKEISLKEAASLCHQRGIPTLNWRGWGGREGKGNGGASSLEMLTESFIARLSVTHPATVSTINRTADKLVFPGDPASTELCPVCQMPVDSSALEWKSQTALTSLPSTPTSDDGDGSKRTNDKSLASLLCYACLTTFTPALSRRDTTMGDPVLLPGFIGEGISSRRTEVARQAMRAEIGEYLLDAGDEGS